MKRFLSIFIIALALASCSNEVEPVVPNVEEIPIAFGDPTTRALVGDVDDLKGGGFGVYGLMNSGAADTAEAAVYATDPALFDNTHIMWNGEKWYYAENPEDLKMWTGQRVYHFFAFYPYVEGLVTPVTANANNGCKLTFTTPAAADVDLLTAHNTVDTSGIVPGQVSFDFDHELVQVNVFVTQDFGKNPSNTSAFRVNSMTLSNIRGKGTLTTSSVGEGATHSWTYDGTSAPLSFTCKENLNTPIADVSGTTVKLSENHLLLIPQNTGSINLTMSYQYATKVDEDWVWQDRSANVNLPAGTWKAGQQVTYNITLYEDRGLVFTQVTVAAWGSNQNGGTIIIK